mmetsp:Transcript_103198/g.166382  ORF Transcript_103198/g.166382 Transcript_103198/m.166382 type:complete len:201 (-) Transcript_103198:267-869(-)
MIRMGAGRSGEASDVSPRRPARSVVFNTEVALDDKPCSHAASAAVAILILRPFAFLLKISVHLQSSLRIEIARLRLSFSAARASSVKSAVNSCAASSVVHPVCLGAGKSCKCPVFGRVSCLSFEKSCSGSGAGNNFMRSGVACAPFASGVPLESRGMLPRADKISGESSMLHRDQSSVCSISTGTAGCLIPGHIPGLPHV